MPNPNSKDTVTLSLSINVNFFSGLMVGLANGVLFHPMDRAFYLRSTDPLASREHIFSPKYWSNPMSALRNTIYQKVLSNSLYFMMQGELTSKLKPFLINDLHYSEAATQMLVGLGAGSTSGFFSNASYAVKFYTINYKPNGKPLESSIEMWHKGGLRPFFNGIYPGVSRDIVFGVLYETTNLIFDRQFLKFMHSIIPEEYKKSHDSLYFTTRFISATFATALSSPFNYARNIQFKTEPDKQQKLAYDILKEAWEESNRETSKQKSQSLLARLSFFQDKFMIGAGTARAGLGMAVGQMLFNKIKPALCELDQDTSTRNTVSPEVKI